MNLAVFDIDGTLIQYHAKRNDRAYVRAMAEVFGTRIEDSADSWSGFASSTDSGILREWVRRTKARNLTRQEISLFKKTMARFLEKEYGDDPFLPMPGAHALWDQISIHSRWKMAIATGNWDFAGRFKLESAKFDPIYVPMASADDGEAREQVLRASKHRASKQYEIQDFDKIVYVGDWTWDVMAAKA